MLKNGFIAFVYVIVYMFIKSSLESKTHPNYVWLFAGWTSLLLNFNGG